MVRESRDLPNTDVEERDRLALVADFAPAGDQPEAIRQLAVARDGAVKARSAALCQLGDLATTAPAEIRERLAVRVSLEAKAKICQRFRVADSTSTDPHRAAKLALRSIARRIADLTSEMDALDAAGIVFISLIGWRLVPKDRTAGRGEQLEGLEAGAAAWEADVLPVRMQGYDPSWLDQLCISGRVTWSRRTRPTGRASSRTSRSSARRVGLASARNRSSSPTKNI